MSTSFLSQHVVRTSLSSRECRRARVIRMANKEDARACESVRERVSNDSGLGRRGIIGGSLAASGLALLGAFPASSSADISPNLASLGLQDFLSNAQYQQLVQPEAVRFPRRKLNKTFAVLLMRSGYRTLDSLDFFPIDKFQVLFWKLRAAQQDSYNNLYSPLKMKVGDLTDTLYFDFISFSQWAAVDKAIRDARQLFDEPCEECDEYTIKTIKRPPTLTDAMIPTSFEAGVGDRIYAGLRDGFNGETFGAPQAPNRGAPVEEVAAKVGDLVGVMERNGFCIKHDVALVPREEMTEPGAKAQLVVRCEGPAHLWGVQALQFRQSKVANRYDALAVGSMLRAGGWDASYKYRFTDAFTEALWTIR